MRISRAASALLALAMGLPALVTSTTTPITPVAPPAADRDPLLSVDATGATFAIEPPAPAMVTRGATTTTATAEALTLHSKPGSDRVIYLDFDGQSLRGTGWNDSFNGSAPFVAAAFDTDGRPSSFSATELGVIKGVWQRVSEDFAPFDVDVTTAEPAPEAIERDGVEDLEYGTRALITNTTIGYSACRCGGVSYIGTFDSPTAHARYQPALVFQRGVGSSAKSLAEAASHEVGHILGLHHDGTSTLGYFKGHGAWAPIMGVGYYRPVSQWSRGEYAGATNKEDDIAVMAANGVVARPDDHAGTIAGSTRLAGATPKLIGRITTRRDVDAFSFATGGGVATVTVRPRLTGADLDVRLRVLDRSGRTIAISNPPLAMLSPDRSSGLEASVRVTLRAGTYVVLVDGVGSGSALTDGYSDYGSIGTYALSASVPRPVA